MCHNMSSIQIKAEFFSYKSMQEGIDVSTSRKAR